MSILIFVYKIRFDINTVVLFSENENKRPFSYEISLLFLLVDLCTDFYLIKNGNINVDYS
jgi:hypothetical protein